MYSVIKVEEIEKIKRERELERQRQLELELERERQRKLIEEEHRLELQRQQEQLEELEHRRASRDSLSMTSEDTSYICDDHVTSTPKKSDGSEISMFKLEATCIIEHISLSLTTLSGVDVYVSVLLFL